LIRDTRERDTRERERDAREKYPEIDQRLSCYLNVNLLFQKEKKKTRDKRRKEGRIKEEEM